MYTPYAEQGGFGVRQQLPATYAVNKRYTFTAAVGKGSATYTSTLRLRFLDASYNTLATKEVSASDILGTTNMADFEVSFRVNQGDAFIGDNVTIAFQVTGSGISLVWDNARVDVEDDYTTSSSTSSVRPGSPRWLSQCI